MKFKIFYCIFIVGSLLYSNLFLFGSVSIRHILAVVMFLWLCLINEVKFDKFIWAILGFVFFLGISSFLTGYADTFLKKLLGTYFVGLVIYMSSATMVRRYNAFSWIFWCFIGLAFLDAIVTIGQFFNSPLAYGIALKLGVFDFQEDMWSSIEAHNGAIGGTGAGGLFGIVKNGIFLCSATILSLYNKNGIKLWNWPLCLFFIIALFFVQERTGLAMGLFGILGYIVLNTQKNKSNIYFIILIIIATAIFIPGLFGGLVNIEDTRYGIHALTGFEGRGELFDRTFDYLNINPFGGAYDYIYKGYTEPHNLIANAFLYGGIFGGIIMMTVSVIQLFKVIKVLWSSFVGAEVSMALINTALIYFGLMVNSFTHNNSLVKGDEVYFLFWGVFSSLSIMEYSFHKRIKLRRR